MFQRMTKRMTKGMTRALLLVAASAVAAPAFAAHPIMIKIGGTITVAGCTPSRTDVTVRTSTGKSTTPTSAIQLGDGRTRLDYSLVVGVQDPDGDDDVPAPSNFDVTPSMKAGVCPGGAFSPTKRHVNEAPALGLNFEYSISGGRRYHLHAAEFAQAVNDIVRTMKMRLHNYGTQDSSVEVKGIRVGFNIPEARIDIDCGTFCPDLGDGLFYVNDVKLTAAAFGLAGAGFALTTAFEDSAREIKGLHNRLGDDAMPDFELSNIRINANAVPRLSNGALGLSFYAPKLIAGIQATGACTISGVELCNTLFNTDGKVRKAVETGALSALNSGTVQAAVNYAVAQWLSAKGVQGRLIGVQLSGEDLVVTAL